MSTSTPDRYKLIFFVPTANVAPCKEAIFAIGAGSFLGDPAVGAVGALERCEEVRVEIMCLGRGIMLNVVDALISAYPYEEVAYEVYKMENV
ncbi:hypothetical protein N7449_002414 [Penicillium cf. viridicatum]|uniref:ATP phosphoribosyltransferase n=1 Tax=Penicillium cf. viridicatum TaxID=2972119 RepID=A0A9W9MVC4_9EURO|nr:hypothetical protein N7449_002414 [Penicillium cf. viridicatum]